MTDPKRTTDGEEEVESIPAPPAAEDPGDAVKGGREASSIPLLDTSSEPVARYDLQQAWPTKIDL